MQETVLLHSPGPIAGFPGASHGPGLVLLDYDNRTVTPVPVIAEQAQPTQAQEQDVPLSDTSPSSSTESVPTSPVALYTNGG